MGEKIEDLIINGNRRLKDLTVVELKCELEKHGLNKYGNKKELSQRLAIFEESRQKSLLAKTKQETPNQWLEEDSNLANDFIRDYFKSQKALLAEHIEQKKQRGECDDPVPIVDSSATNESSLDDAKPSCSRKASKKASIKQHEKPLPEPPPAFNRGVKLTIRTKCDPVISSNLGRQSKNNAESKILSCSLLEESQDGEELETYHRSRRKKPSYQHMEEEKKPLIKPLKIKIGEPPKSTNPPLHIKKMSNSHLTSHEKSYLSPQNAEVSSSSVEEQSKPKLSNSPKLPPEEIPLQVQKLISSEKNISLKSIKEGNVCSQNVRKPKNSLTKPSHCKNETNHELKNELQKTPSTAFLKSKSNDNLTPPTNKRTTRNAINKIKSVAQIPSTKNSSVVNCSKIVAKISQLKKINKPCPDVKQNIPIKKPIISKRSDLFESLKQQIELPLHVEKFPSGEKIEVSSTSELSDQFIQPSIEPASYDFHSICKQIPMLDSQIIVESHLGSDTIPDSRTSSDNKSPPIDPLLINPKDINPLSLCEDKTERTECVQSICVDLGGIPGKSKKDSYLMKNILKDSELSLNCLPNLEEANVETERRNFCSEKLPTVLDAQSFETSVKSKICQEIKVYRVPVIKNIPEIQNVDKKELLVKSVFIDPSEESLIKQKCKVDILEAATLAADIDKTYSSKREIPTDDCSEAENLLQSSIEMCVGKTQPHLDKLETSDSTEQVNRCYSPEDSVFIQHSSQTNKELCTKVVDIVIPENSTNILSPQKLPDASTSESCGGKSAASGVKNVTEQPNDGAIVMAETEIKSSLLLKDSKISSNIASEIDSKSLSPLDDNIVSSESEFSTTNLCRTPVTSIPSKVDIEENVCKPKNAFISLEEESLCIPDTNIASVETDTSSLCITDATVISPEAITKSIGTSHATEIFPEANTKGIVLETVISQEDNSKSIDLSDATVISPENTKSGTSHATEIFPEANTKGIVLETVISQEDNSKSIDLSDATVISPEVNTKSIGTSHPTEIFPEANTKGIVLETVISQEDNSKSIDLSDATVISPEVNTKSIVLPEEIVNSPQGNSKSIGISDASNISSEMGNYTCIADATIICEETDTKTFISDVRNISPETDSESLCRSNAIVESVINDTSKADATISSLQKNIIDLHYTSNIYPELDSKSLLTSDETIISVDKDSNALCITEAIINHLETDGKGLPDAEISSEVDNKSLCIVNETIVPTEMDSKICITDAMVGSPVLDSKPISLHDDTTITSEIVHKSSCLTDSMTISPEMNTESILSTEIHSDISYIADSTKISDADTNTLSVPYTKTITAEMETEICVNNESIISTEKDIKSTCKTNNSIISLAIDNESTLPTVIDTTSCKVDVSPETYCKNICIPEATACSLDDCESLSIPDDSMLSSELSESIVIPSEPESDVLDITKENISPEIETQNLNILSEIDIPPENEPMNKLNSETVDDHNKSFGLTLSDNLPKIEDIKISLLENEELSETSKNNDPASVAANNEPTLSKNPFQSEAATLKEVSCSEIALPEVTPTSLVSVEEEHSPISCISINMKSLSNQNVTNNELSLKTVAKECFAQVKLSKTDKTAPPSLPMHTVSEESMSISEAALNINPSSDDTCIHHYMEEPSDKLSLVEMGKRRKSKSSEDHKKSRHNKDDLSPSREKTRKPSICKEEPAIAIASENNSTNEVCKKSVISLETKIEETVPENNNHNEKSLSKEVVTSLPEDSKDKSEDEKKVHSRSGRTESSRDSHKQRSKDKRKSRSPSSEKVELKRRKKSSRRSDDHSRHSTDRVSHKSKKREVSETQLEKVTEPTVPVKDHVDDTLEILLNPEPDSSLLEEDNSMDIEPLKVKIPAEEIKSKKDKHAKKDEEIEKTEKKDTVPFKSARKVTVNRSKGSEDSGKRKWGSSRDAKPTLGISSFSLKALIPDVKPLSPSELKLETGSEKSSDGEATPDENRERVNGRVDDAAKEDTPPPKESQRKRHHSREKQTNRDRESKRDRSSRREDSRRRHDDKGSDRPSRAIHIVESSMPPTKKGIPMSRNPISPVIIVANLVRPFTVKQLKDLLQRTGTLVEKGFWIDNIKSKCIAMFEKEDEAEETRIALHGVKWPSVNPKHLLVDYCTEAELKKKLQESPHLNPIIVDDAKFERKKVDRPVREWDLAKMGEKSPGERERERERKRRDREQERSKERRKEDSPRPSDREIAKKVVEVKSLDDLFNKTKSQPSIYWLPLSGDEIAEKEAMRRHKMADQERREAEMKVAHERQRAERIKERQRRRERSRSNRRSRRSRSSGRRRRSKSRSRSRS